MSIQICSSDNLSDSAIGPCLMPLARILSRLRPRPSSLHGDTNIAALVEGIEANDACSRFAGRDAFGRRFETMIRGVSHEVRQWITDRLDHGLIQFGFLAG